MKPGLEQFVASRAFRSVIIFVILVAGVVAGLETNASLMAQYGALFRVIDQLILAIFIGEALLKMAAHGRKPWRYFSDGWNVFDFLIIVISLIPVGVAFAPVLRVARVLRVLRLVSVLPKLQLLVGALLKSLSAMGYVSLLLALLFYLYAVAGVQLFGPTDPENFGSLGMALLTLFRVVTLDNWGDIFLYQLEHVAAIKVTIYFVTFIVFGTMIILNLFIGIIMNSMAEMHAEIAARDQEERTQNTSNPSLDEELKALEGDLKATQARLATLRRALNTATQVVSNNNQIAA